MRNGLEFEDIDDNNYSSENYSYYEEEQYVEFPETSYDIKTSVYGFDDYDHNPDDYEPGDTLYEEFEPPNDGEYF